MFEVPLPEMPDAELIALCLKRGAKDDRPFQELFRRYKMVVWRICYSYTRNAEDVEDVTQEVFFKAYRNLNKFEGRSSFKTWIYRVAINTWQNEMRRRDRRPQLVEKDTDTLAEVLPSQQSVEATLYERQQRQYLTDALANLPVDTYEILYMKDFEERPYAEIADTLGISLSAAKMRVQRPQILGRFVFWIIFLNFILITLENLGLQATVEPLRALIAFLPRLLAALATLTAGVLLAQFLGKAAMGSMGVDFDQEVVQGVNVLLIIMVVIVVLEQLGIDASIMTNIFTNVITIIVAGLALAFGLGGRDVARNVLAVIMPGNSLPTAITCVLMIRKAFWKVSAQ